MLKFENVATPLAAATVVVSSGDRRAGKERSATVTPEQSEETVLPWASWTASGTAGVVAAPAAALLGGRVKTSFAAAPTPMLNALLVAPVSPVAVAVSV